MCFATAGRWTNRAGYSILNIVWRMNFFELLNISPGVTAVIGSGGKTSLLRRLAAEAPGTVLLCTTTHIRPFAEYPLLTDAAAETVLQALTSERVLCVGTPCENGKLTAPRLPMEMLAALADYMLVEADGSRQMPLKAHAAHEPVIPACAERVICVAGASGFDRPIRACVHRPERFCALTGAAETDTVAPLLAAQAILTEGLCDTVFLNQVDNAELLGRVMPFLRTAAAGGLFTAAGSLQGDWGKRF